MGRQRTQNKAVAARYLLLLLMVAFPAGDAVPALAQLAPALQDSTRRSEPVPGSNVVNGVSANGGRPVAQTSDGNAQTGNAETGEGELLLRTGNGELVPLGDLLGVDYRSVVDEMLKRVQQQLSVPSWRFSRLELTGEVSRDVLTLAAELTISVERDHEWVTVPVAFSDLHIDDIAHEADSEHGRAIPETSDPTKKRWHLYGAGIHRIRLKLIGKTRPQSTVGHSLNLDLPSATISHAMIRFMAPVELKLPPETVQKITQSDTGATAVEFWGLTPSFSMSWVEVVPQVTRKPVIQVQNNRMKLDLNSIPVTLSGTQAVQISGSPVNELTILFPAGFQLLEVTALNQADDSVLSGFEVTSVPTGSSAVIRLSGPMEGILKLNFELELVNRTFPQDIVFRIPVVRDANVQSGDLDIGIPPGLLMQTRIEGAQRKRVASETDINVQATAFRLRSVDSVVVLHVEEIQAQYAVSPEMVFEPDAENVLMTVRFPVNVLTGSLLDLKVKWPGFSGGSWQMLPGTTLLISDKQSLPLSQEQDAQTPDSFKLTFPERQSGQFRVEFKAFAPITSLRPAGAALICPSVESRESEPIIVTTIESDTYSLQPINAETSRPLQTAPFQSAAIAEAASRNRNAQAWLHNQPEEPLSLDLIRQAPSVTTAMVVGLIPREAGIEVHEDITFQIEHSELSALGFIVPEGVQPSVSMAGETERLRATMDSTTSWSFRLPTSRRGTVRVSVDYLWQVDRKDTDDDLTLELPLVLPQPQTSEMTRCEVGTSVTSGLRVKDEQNWSPVFSDRFEAAWLIEGPASSVPVRWQRSVSLNSGGSPIFLISRTRLTVSEVSTTTVAVFENGGKQFSFVLPENVKPVSILVNGRTLKDTGGKIYRAAAGPFVRWQVSLGDSDAKSSAPAVIPVSGGVVQNTSPAESDPSGLAVIVEIQCRERIERTSSLFERAVFHRPVFEQTGLPAPSIWMFESQNEFRTISRSRVQTSLSGVQQLWMSAGSRASEIESKVAAILTPYPASLQSRLRDKIDDWTSIEHRQDLFFSMSDAGPLSVYLIPGVSLLLVSAGVCAAFFGVMCLLRLPSLAVPLLFIVAAVPAMYLVIPEWTILLSPYAGVGIVLGIVSLTFQRMGTVRLRFPGRGRAGEMLTIFGYTGFLSGTSSVVQSDADGPAVTESSALSAR